MKVINIAKEYTTERGNPTRLLVDNVQHTAFPILGLELLPNGEEIIRQWNDMGYSITGEHDLKLIPKPPKIIRKITKYIAVYKSENNNKGCILGGVFSCGYF